MASVFQRGLIYFEPIGEHRNWIHRTAGKDWITIRAGERESVGAVGSEPYRRMRPLNRLGKHFDAVNALLRPCQFDRFEAVFEPAATVGHPNSVAAVVERERAAAGAEFDAATTQHVERRDFFGQPDRMMQRHQVDGHAEADVGRALGNRG
jgi:hypothetical protein